MDLYIITIEMDEDSVYFGFELNEAESERFYRGNVY